MALEVLDEHEQGELVQKWLRENAVSIATGIVIGLLLIFGWQQWRAHQVQHRLDAAVEYQKLLEDFDHKNVDAANQLAQKIRSDFGNTPYAMLAAMQQADAALTAGDRAGALSAMDWAWQHTDMPSLKSLAAIRLARLKLADGSAEDALKLLGPLPKSDYSALADELRGDTLLALGRKDEARTAYRDALSALDAGAPNRQLLQMKLDDLASIGEKQSS